MMFSDICVVHLHCVERSSIALVSLQLPKGDPEQVAEKKKTMKFRDVDFLAFSYKELVKIENLTGFDKLTKLKLDCNRITTIEGLSQLVCAKCLSCANGIMQIPG
jgi:hypothetical protein